MARILSYSSTVFLLFSALSFALEVAPNSPCALKCLDDPKNGNVSDRTASLTFHQNLACFDDEYVGKNTSDIATKFAECQSCLQGSGFEDEVYGERDTSWFSCRIPILHV
jgi:hypothetical protein